MNASSKYLLMAAVDIAQQLADRNGAVQTLAMENKKPDYDDFCSLMGCKLETLQKTLQLIADSEEEDISTASLVGNARPDPVDRNRAPAGRLAKA